MVVVEGWCFGWFGGLGGLCVRFVYDGRLL